MKHYKIIPLLICLLSLALPAYSGWNTSVSPSTVVNCVVGEESSVKIKLTFADYMSTVGLSSNNDLRVEVSSDNPDLLQQIRISNKILNNFSSHSMMGVVTPPGHGYDFEEEFSVYSKFSNPLNDTLKLTIMRGNEIISTVSIQYYVSSN